MELTQIQKNKLMAAADIVEHGDMAVLKKLLEFQDILDSITVDIDGNKIPIENAIKELKSSFEDSIYRVKQDVVASRIEIKDVISQIVSKLDSLSNDVDKTELLNKIKTLSSEINTVKATMPSMPDLSALEAKISQVEASIPTIKEDIEETPLEIRDKLESIKIENEKLDILAIQDLRKELDELKKIRSTGRSYSLFGGGGSSSGGRTVQAYDLSASLNGVLKSFVLPAFWRVLSVHSSSFPYVFRPTVDYTISGTTITFTDEIEVSTTLSTGQSLIILYAE